MIPFASQRGGGQDLATHLQNSYDNELTEVAELRGAVAEDLHGAFKEWEVQAETLTRCRKYLYSLSINPDPAQGEMTRAQYFDYIARAEQALGLADQPRAVVFHVKHGREHCHVVWSRVDADHHKAVHIAFDREKLMHVTRAFARDHFFDLPPGYDKSRQKGQESLYERAQQSATGLSKADHKAQVTGAWQGSDDAKSFVHALSECGYILATGKRPYVLVDRYGGSHALAKLIDDKTVRTRDLRAFLEKDFPEDSLPSVDEAEALVAKHQKLVEKVVNEERLGDHILELKHEHALRRLAAEQEAQALAAGHLTERDALDHLQRSDRSALLHRQAATVADIEARRAPVRAAGLAGFFGRITGISAIRRAIHRHQDDKVMEAQRHERIALTQEHEERRKSLRLRQDLQLQDLDRNRATLTRLETREIAALKRDLLCAQRTQARCPENVMAPVLQPQGHGKAIERAASPFREAARSDAAPDVKQTFHDAAKSRSESGGDGDTRGPAKAPPDERLRDR